MKKRGALSNIRGWIEISSFFSALMELDSSSMFFFELNLRKVHSQESQREPRTSHALALYPSPHLAPGLWHHPSSIYSAVCIESGSPPRSHNGITKALTRPQLVTTVRIETPVASTPSLVRVPCPSLNLPFVHFSFRLVAAYPDPPKSTHTRLQKGRGSESRTRS